MLRLDLDPQPLWLDLLPGVRVKVLPMRSAVMLAAIADDAVLSLPEDCRPEERAVALAKGAAAAAILEWEGVCDADGAPLPATPENARALMDVFDVFLPFDRLYMAKGVALRREGNALPPSPAGTSSPAGATPTARPARGGAKTARGRKTGR